ncbi:hypothetical protein T492DRAFT_906525, partial [Pavlovales sp. CCMP2436]
MAPKAKVQAAAPTAPTVARKLVLEMRSILGGVPHASDDDLRKLIALARSDMERALNFWFDSPLSKIENVPSACAHTPTPPARSEREPAPLSHANAAPAPSDCIDLCGDDEPAVPPTLVGKPPGSASKPPAKAKNPGEGGMHRFFASERPSGGSAALGAGGPAYTGGPGVWPRYLGTFICQAYATTKIFKDELGSGDSIVLVRGVPSAPAPGKGTRGRGPGGSANGGARGGGRGRGGGGGGGGGGVSNTVVRIARVEQSRDGGKPVLREVGRLTQDNARFLAPLIDQKRIMVRQALTWMLAREACESDVPSLHPCWAQFAFAANPPRAEVLKTSARLGWEEILGDLLPPDELAETLLPDSTGLSTGLSGAGPKHFYINPTTGQASLERPIGQRDPRGGILADEMGLGKTVEMIALICADFEEDALAMEKKSSNLNHLSNSNKANKLEPRRVEIEIEDLDDEPQVPKPDDAPKVAEGGGGEGGDNDRESGGDRGGEVVADGEGVGGEEGGRGAGWTRGGCTLRRPSKAANGNREVANEKEAAANGSRGAAASRAANGGRGEVAHGSEAASKAANGIAAAAVNVAKNNSNSEKDLLCGEQWTPVAPSQEPVVLAGDSLAEVESQEGADSQVKAEDGARLNLSLPRVESQEAVDSQVEMETGLEAGSLPCGKWEGVDLQVGVDTQQEGAGSSVKAEGLDSQADSALDAMTEEPFDDERSALESDGGFPRTGLATTGLTTGLTIGLATTDGGFSPATAQLGSGPVQAALGGEVAAAGAAAAAAAGAAAVGAAGAGAAADSQEGDQEEKGPASHEEGISEEEEEDSGEEYGEHSGEGSDGEEESEGGSERLCDKGAESDGADPEWQPGSTQELRRAQPRRNAAVAGGDSDSDFEAQKPPRTKQKIGVSKAGSHKQPARKEPPGSARANGGGGFRGDASPLAKRA